MDFTVSGGRTRACLLDLRLASRHTAALLLLCLVITAASSAHGRDKKVLQYGAGLIVNIPLPEPEVEQVIEDIAQNTIIRGTKEYNKDEYVAHAVAATSTTAFAPWTQGGKVLYKVASTPSIRGISKTAAMSGTLAVRYVVQPQGDNNTVLRIDAIFVEDFRPRVPCLGRFRRKRRVQGHSG